MPKQPRDKRGDDNKTLAALAKDAVEAFREENPEAYDELARAFEGKGADLALLGGHGRFHAELRDGQVHIDPERVGGPTLTARGAASPETIMAILEGRLTPLEGFFKGDVIAQASSADLHIAYGYFAQFADTALRSESLQKILKRFRETYPTQSRFEDWTELD